MKKVRMRSTVGLGLLLGAVLVAGCSRMDRVDPLLFVSGSVPDVIRAALDDAGIHLEAQLTAPPEDLSVVRLVVGPGFPVELVTGVLSAAGVAHEVAYFAADAHLYTYRRAGLYFPADGSQLRAPASERYSDICDDQFVELVISATQAELEAQVWQGDRWVVGWSGTIQLDPEGQVPEFGFRLESDGWRGPHAVVEFVLDGRPQSCPLRKR